VKVYTLIWIANIKNRPTFRWYSKVPTLPFFLSHIQTFVVIANNLPNEKRIIDICNLIFKEKCFIGMFVSFCEYCDRLTS
jgi:hypothetical protein